MLLERMVFKRTWTLINLLNADFSIILRCVNGSRNTLNSITVDKNMILLLEEEDKIFIIFLEEIKLLACQKQEKLQLLLQLQLLSVQQLPVKNQDQQQVVQESVERVEMLNFLKNKLQNSQAIIRSWIKKENFTLAN